MNRSLYLLFSLILFSTVAFAQITAPDADGNAFTQYPEFSETDNIFVFCSADTLAQNGSLTVTTTLSGTKTFLWEKYNEQTTSFEFYSQEIIDAESNEITNLADGCYRATVTSGTTTDVFRAWVFNNWILADAEVVDSNCETFRLSGSFKSAELIYYDLSSNAGVELQKTINVEWYEGDTRWSTNLNFQVFDPPTEDTEYTLQVFDQFGCEGISDVLYESMITEAKFSVDANWTNASQFVGEAPLTVTFNNESKNGTPGYYEWFFYRDIDEIKREAERGGEVDSIMLIAYDDAPVYTFENSGTYMVRLVSKHITESFTCVDTFTFENYIVADTSSIIGANVFTPNGDGVNDDFVIRFQSMRSLEISIVNRWGRVVHSWQSGDIMDPENARTESVWDGRIGARYASPGVYYWNAYGVGRDDRKQSKHGFVHLFRGRD